MVRGGDGHWGAEEAQAGWPRFKVGVLSRSVGARVGSAQASDGSRKSVLDILLMDLYLQAAL